MRFWLLLEMCRNQRDDKDLTDDRVDPHVEKKQRVAASTMDLYVEKKPELLH